ncbi:MAG: hypothetical protein JW774_08790, partial [Candidatus Aureabacteria bacterium]|nr:hypothetical protein [Candidatus Auribacterota bacterium]
MLSFFKPVAFNLIGDKAACDKSFRGTKKDTPFLKKTLLAGLTVLLFHSPFPSYAELLPIDIQAVTLDYSKPEDDILRFFLKELAKTAYEEGHYSNVLTDPKMFDVFFRNFTYKPDYLIDKIPLKKTSTISKMIQATLRDLIPHYAEAILTADKEYFLFCNTIRGNHILCITKKPLFQPLYEDLHHELFLSILTVKNFLNNILREPVYFESLQNTPSFGRLLLQEVQPVKSPSFSDINLPYFIETLPSLGYDVASLANEARFFKGETEQEREWCFYSLPIVQYAVRDKKQLNHFFFKLDDPVSLKQILELLTNENGKGATLLKKHIQSYISLKQNHEFPTMNPHEKFSEFFENLHYSINYDAIPAAHTSKLYQNVINYILSQGISNFNELSKNKEMIITVINKFFTLGTTYFFRHWSMLSDFPDHLSDAIKEARSHKRPLKVSVFACSTGEEVLTIAFSFLDKGITDFTILGSDINEAYIEQAKKMTYAMQNFERIPDNIRGPVIKKYFKKNGDGNYEIKDKDFFNRRISYIVLDITKPLPSDLPKEWAPPYDLISCQNIFLYLSDKFVSRLYKNLLKLLNENGLFILVDKIYSHNLLKKCNLSRKTLHINDIIIKLIPQKMTDQQIYQSLKEINKEGPYSFAAIRQINDLALFNPPQKRAWFKELMHQKGDRSLIYYLVGKNNLKLGAYSEAEEVLTKGIWQSPYLLNNYWMLEEVKKKLGKKSDAEYLNVISKAIKLFYSNRAYKDLTEILNLFQKAIKKEPDNMLGFYVFGYQLIRYGLFLKDNNGSLLDYERFFNQA